jgi:hypothetical protein
VPIAADASGNFLVVWVQSSTLSLRWRWFDANGGWGDATPGVADVFFFPRIVLDPSGNGFAAWAGPKDQFASRYARSLGFERNATKLNSQATVRDTYEPSLAADGNGNAIAAWSQEEEPDVRVGLWVAAGNGNGWTQGQRVAGVLVGGVEALPGALRFGPRGIGNPRVALTPSGDGMITWSEYDGDLTIWAAALQKPSVR